MVTPTLSCSRHHSLRIRPALVAILGLAIASLGAASANAALREYRVQFAPSVSASATGYTLHVGQSSGTYEINFDLGTPPAISSMPSTSKSRSISLSH